MTCTWLHRGTRPQWWVILAWACLCAGLLHGKVHAQAVSASEAKAIRATVQRQLDAFERDDASAAFALASSAARQRFGSAEKFMATVKEQYRAVYRHRVAFFTAAQRIDGDIVQSVRLTDADDRVWVALYRLEREADGQWRIVGCQLLETKSVST